MFKVMALKPNEWFRIHVRRPSKYKSCGEEIVTLAVVIWRLLFWVFSRPFHKYLQMHPNIQLEMTLEGSLQEVSMAYSSQDYFALFILKSW